MKKKSNAQKEIQRDQYFKIRMSKEEKELFYKYAESLGVNPSRAARTLLLMEAEKNLISKGIEIAALKAYRKYLEVTKQFDILERMEKD